MVVCEHSQHTHVILPHFDPDLVLDIWDNLLESVSHDLAFHSANKCNTVGYKALILYLDVVCYHSQPTNIT